ncbi:MAG TPA: nodulation protein NfeD [Dokdonella sp.]|uniref:NfeD family protein n=1 Tax=Dokdonella sp. TaxID=2291710 RepID=UPI002D8057DB|nr:nodulation protein NfeD [Dokdonella sp.]HET9033778.1 nodulation protein NfeD [Dokdonella sp.]
MKRFLAACLSIAGTLLVAVALAQGSGAASESGFVARIQLNGPIGPAAAEYFDSALQRADTDGASAIVLQLDTPGGLSTSMRQIVSSMLAADVPILGYVAPDGARAASAGTYILYAAQIAAMAPATHLGAATPVSIGGGMLSPAKPDPAADDKGEPAKSDNETPKSDAKPDAKTDSGDAESSKVLNDSIAYIRTLAQLRGRNADWAEKAVRDAATLTASEAVAAGVIDFIAVDTADLLAKTDGREVRVGERTLTLKLGGMEVREYAPNWRNSFLGVITNPTVAYLLLLAGIYGLVLEAMHPGGLLPGVVGAISLLVGLYALQMLPVNYAGLALMLLGIGLLVAEAFTPAYGTLGLGGTAAFIFGSILLLDTDVPGFSINVGVIGGIAAGACGLLAVVLWLVMRARRAHIIGGDQQMLDAQGEMLDAISVGGVAQARFLGERWQVRSEQALPAGTRVRVLRRDGLTLWVTAE